MRLEQAIPCLRDGLKIYRKGRKGDVYLKGTTEMVLGSYYMTIYDILAEDWIATIYDEGEEYDNDDS